jgi:hypothetical protein
VLENGKTRSMLSYDLMLEVDGVLRSRDLRTKLDRDLEPGERIGVYGRKWVVTVVRQGGGELDRRAIAHEIVDEGHT